MREPGLPLIDTEPDLDCPMELVTQASGFPSSPSSPGLEARRAQLAERAAERASAHHKRMQDMQERLKQGSQTWSADGDASNTPPLEKLLQQAVSELDLKSPPQPAPEPTVPHTPERCLSTTASTCLRAAGAGRADQKDQLEALSPECRRRVEEAQNKHRRTLQQVDDGRQQGERAAYTLPPDRSEPVWCHSLG